MEKLVKNIVRLNFDEFPDFDLPVGERFGLIVNYNDVDYEFLIHIKPEYEKLFVLGSGVIPKNEFAKFEGRPIFKRQSWDSRQEMDFSTIFFNDPTRTIFPNLQGGWGVGTPDDYFLENISLILKKIFSYYDVANDDVVFYSSSMGGFMSIQLATLIPGTLAWADVPQTDIRNYYYFNRLKENIFKDNVDNLDEYVHRFNVIELMKKMNYVPPIYMVVDIVNTDMNNQFIPFFNSLYEELNSLNKLKIIINPVNKHTFLVYKQFILVKDYLMKNGFDNINYLSLLDENQIKCLYPEEVSLNELKETILKVKDDEKIIPVDKDDENVKTENKRDNYEKILRKPDSKFYSEEFFIITSDNLDEVQSSFVGFTIIDNEVVSDKDKIQPDKLDGTGAYVYVDRQDDKISIYQDFAGCFGLYLFEDKKDGFFAISNSFLRLVEYLKDIKYLNIDFDYAKSFIPVSIVSIAYGRTLIKEISLISKNDLIEIDITEKVLNHNEIDYEYQSVELYSEKAMSIIDTWFNKWSNIFNNIYSETDNINLELSGGFDTRVSLALFLSSNVDLNNINVRASKLKDPTKTADLKISSKMAEHFGFKLNKGLNVKKNYFKSIDSILALSFYSKLGCSKQMYWKNGVYDDRIYTVGGYGGEIIRYFYKFDSIENFLLYNYDVARKYSKTLLNPTENILNYAFDEYSKWGYDKKDTMDFLNVHYHFTRNRYHFGKSIVESFLANEIRLNPLMDPLLSKIKLQSENYQYDTRILALIYLRFCPELLDFEFEGDRAINQKNLDNAKRIIEKYPFKADKKQKECIHKEKNKSKKVVNKPVITNNDVFSYFKDVFQSDYYKKLFAMYFPLEIYEKIKDSLLKAESRKYDDVVGVVTMLKIIMDVHYNHLKFNTTPLGLTDLCLENSKNVYIEENKDEVNFKNLEKYYTARIDMKNNGAEDNDIEMLSVSDELARVFKPNWMANSKGKGVQIESTRGVLDLKFKCIGSGNLRIVLRGKYVLDANRKRFSVFVDYSNFKINSDVIFERNKIVSEYKPYVFRKAVKSGEVVDFHIEWNAFNERSSID